MVRLVLDRSGKKNDVVGHFTRQDLINDGFPASVPNQTAHVYVIE